MKFEDHMLVEYLRRAYHAVDGLWFVMAEEADGFDTALELDRRVWEVLAKIQARKARELTGCSSNEAEGLARCLALKLTADGHEFTTAATADGVHVDIRRCPWLDALRKSQREDIALQVAEVVCLTEGRVWCQEFGGEYEFEMPVMACAGADRCEMRFARRSEE